MDSIRESSLTYVQQNAHELIEKFSNKATAVLSAAIPSDLNNEGYGFLAFLCSYGIVPTILVTEVLKLNPVYHELFTTFKALTICRFLGSVGEYVEVNPLIADYVQRNRFSLPWDIEQLLTN